MGSRPNDAPAVARALHEHPARRRARALAPHLDNLAAQIAGSFGAGSIPHRAARKLRHLVVSRYPDITVFEPAPTAHSGPGPRRQILLVSHDLSQSGGPRVVVELARMFAEDGSDVTVLSAADGPRRAELLACGATVIVDPAIVTAQSVLPARIAGGFDVAICNTVATHQCAARIAALVPTILYTHEISLIDELRASSAELDAAFARVGEVWAGSELTAALVRPVRPDVVVMPYGLDPLGDPAGDAAPVGARDPAVLGVFASFEPRKGQDLLAEAVALLDPAVRRRLRIRMYGRILYEDFHAALAARAADLPQVELLGPLDADGYRAALLACDALVVPSRSDTLPLVSLDALGAGRLLLCTRTTGTSAYLDEGRTGFVAETADPAAIAGMLAAAMNCRERWPAIAAGGRAVFERQFSRAAFTRSARARVGALAAAEQVPAT